LGCSTDINTTWCAGDSNVQGAVSPLRLMIGESIVKECRNAK
jgi:hypothetical protein